MEQPQRARDSWRYPSAWADHLLKTYPGVVASPTWRPMSRKRNQEDRPLRLNQLHDMSRDEQGRFNQLAGGVPDLTEDAYEFLENAVEDMRAEGGMRNVTPLLPHGRSLVETIDPFAIEAAIAQLKVDSPRLWAILRFFQTPPALRQYDSVEAFGRWELDPPAASEKQVYRDRRWAIYGVWERLPLAERNKVAGEA